MFRAKTLVCVLPALLTIAACDNVVKKSENPLSPTIAGPIAGVDISVPAAIDPAAGAQIATTAQPLTLTVQNSSTSGVRPVSYRFEVASDGAFATKLFEKGGVEPGADGRTSVRMADALPTGHTYYWRVKAEDGANASEYSHVASFSIYTPVVIGAPTPYSPGENVTVTTRTPTLEVVNASVSGPAGDIYYLFEGATDEAFANKVASSPVRQGNGHTAVTVPSNLAYGTVYFWHARAFDDAHTGPWSRTLAFVTPAAPAAPPGSGGGGSGGGGGGGSANPADEVNLTSAVIKLGPSGVWNWGVTSTVTNAYAQTGALCIYHTRLGNWPTTIFFGDPGTLVEGNQWVFANIGGTWYGGAADWYRPGQACKDVDDRSIAGDAFYMDSAEPLRSWRPHVNEQFAVMSTTPARAWPDMATIDQRTNTVLIRWGG